MGLRWALALVAMLALALACGGGELPAPLPTATPTPAGTPTPTAPPPSTPARTPTPAPRPTPTAAPTPTPEPTPTPFPTPTGPAVAVTGPLIVFSDRIGAITWAEDGGQPMETRRVYVYDLGADTYWAAFDYQDAVDAPRRRSVELAGTRLIVWTEGQLRRVGLNGYTEAVLFEADYDGAVELKASPDGAKVALRYGETLLVLDVATGEELLRVPTTLRLGNWHADGDSLTVTAEQLGETVQTVLVSLDGTQRELPETWLPSPDLRRAVRFTEPPNSRGFAGEGFEVVDVRSEAVLATVAPENHPSLAPYEVGTMGTGGTGWYGTGWRSPPDRYLYFEVTSGSGTYRNQYQLILPDWEYGTNVWWDEEFYGILEPRILDVSTGEHRALSRAEWHSIQREGLRSECDWGWWSESRPEPPPCLLLYGEEFSWHGVDIRAIGVVEDAPIALRGITPVKRWRQPDVPALPARDSLVGPILVWSTQGETGHTVDEYGSNRLYERKNLRMYDEGTKKTWKYDLAVQLYHPFHAFGEIEVVRDGFITWEWDRTIDYVNVIQNHRKTILGDVGNWFDVQISHDGTFVAVDWAGFWAPDRPTVVFDILSGKEIIRIDKAQIPIDSLFLDIRHSILISGHWQMLSWLKLEEKEDAMIW